MDKLLLAARERLNSFGYVFKDGDEALMSLAVKRAESGALNDLGRPDIPEGLIPVVADMAAGEFLRAKRTFSPADIAVLAGSPMVKQISLGDAQTSFAVNAEDSPEVRLDRFISYLLEHGKGELSCYRKIRW